MVAPDLGNPILVSEKGILTEALVTSLKKANQAIPGIPVTNPASKLLIAEL